MKVGDQVGWQWGTGLATGVVVEVNRKRTQIESKDKIITRNGRADDPAIVITSDNGSKVLKLEHELQVIKGGNHV